MTPSPPDHGFFVGYFKKLPLAVVRFAVTAGVGLVAGLIGMAVALSMATDDPGSGRYVDRLAGQALTGVVDLLPYPILRVPAGPDGPARAVMLGGQGKQGVAAGAEPLAGQMAEAGGVFVERGDLTILLVGGPVGLRPSAVAAPSFRPAEPVALGRWRLAGEICDGKCYAGAMRPGSGLSHKACANLCLTGGLPPVFVLGLPVEGSATLLLADAAGGPIPAALLELTALPIELEGTLERRDDLLVFKVDPASARRL